MDRDSALRPRRLYTADDLLDGFDASQRLGVTSTWDFRTYQGFVAAGGVAPRTLGDGLVQAVHDAEIAESLRQYLRDRTPRLVGVMGGHQLARDEPAFRAVAGLAKRMGEAGFTVATGGGPGAMEAAHLGAAAAGQDDSVVNAAIAAFGDAVAVPNLIGVLDDDGTIREDRVEDLAAAHVWLAAALRARSALPEPIAESLAIPTWLYGQEPTMPFATAYAKYFQNSIREDALVRNSRAGIIYARGGGGTLREIFQDVEENFYAPTADEFTPMIFFDPDGYWEHSASPEGPDGIKLDAVVRDVIGFAHRRKPDVAAYQAKVLFTTDVDEIIGVCDAHQPFARAAMVRMLA